MSTTSNLKLNKHDNVSTNTNPFDIDNYLNANWDKIDEYAGNTNSTILKLQEENARLKETIKTELEERTIEAESIEVNDSAEANCEIDLQGNTTQESSPNPDYPSKVETVGSNINILNLQNGTKGHNGVTLETNNGIINSNGTASSTSFNTIYLEEPITLKANQTYVLSANNESTIGAANASSNYASLRLQYNSTAINNTDAILGNKNAFKSFTFTEDTLVDSIVVRTGQGLTMNNFIIKPKLEQSKISSPYSPYGKGSVEVKVSNKNRLENKAISGTQNGITYTINDDKSVTLNGTSTAITWIILNSKITLPRGTYTMSSGKESNSARLYCGAIGNFTDKGIRTVTLTEEKTSDVSINIVSGVTLENFTIYPMIEKGTTATDYVQHKEQIYLLYLPFELCKIGEYKDYIFKENNKWYKHKVIGKFTFTGNEPWQIAGDNQDFYEWTNTFFRHMPNKIGICNRYQQVGISIAGPNTQVGLSIALGNPNLLRARPKDELLNNIENFKNDLKDNTTILYSILETPIDEEITDTTLIQQLNELENAMSYYGTTYVDTTNEVIKPILKFTYNRSNRLRIENLENAIINS